MDLNELFRLQKNLDNISITNNDHNITNNISQKVLALQISIGNLARITNCCEFTPSTDILNTKNLLNEYVSCLNYIFSIGSDMGVENFGSELITSTYPLSDQFLNLYVDINDFINFRTEDQFSTLLENFLTIGVSLNLSIEDVYTVYSKRLEKKSIN